MLASRRPVLLSLDVEADERKVAACQAWTGTDTALDLLGRVRQQLAALTGTPVRFNWFFRMDPQVEAVWGRADWTVDSLPGLLETLARHEDHAGIHVHVWKWNERRQLWYSEFSDPAWLEHCLRSSVEAFRTAFGRPPVSCRFGDRWLSEDAVQAEAALGIQYDLTIEPGLPDMPLFDDPLATAGLPDFRDALRHPYRPRAGSYLQDAGYGPLWMLPLTTSRPRLRPVRRMPFMLNASYPLNMALSPRVIGPILDAEFNRVTSEPLVMVLRTGDAGVPHFIGNIERNFARLLGQKGLGDCYFTTPPDAIAHWTARKTPQPAVALPLALPVQRAE